MASKDDHKSKNKNSASSPKTTKKTKKTEAKAPVEPENRKRGLKMVGIGASAGGLEALQSFFEALPPETGMAFVVITHLHPEHESHMAELLQRQTPMPSDIFFFLCQSDGNDTIDGVPQLSGSNDRETRSTGNTNEHDRALPEWLLVEIVRDVPRLAQRKHVA